LAYCLGETLTDEEAEKFISELDTDRNGTVEFPEFLAWWTKPDSIRSSQNTGGAKLQLLKLRLQSQSYMRTVSRLLTRADEMIKKAEKEASQGAQASDEAFLFEQSITAGEFGDAPASISLALETDQENHPVQLNVHLGIKPVATTGDVVNLVAAIKTMLDVGIQQSPKLSTDLASSHVESVEHGGEKFIKMSFEPKVDAEIAMFNQIVNALDIDIAEIKIELSGTLTSDDILKARESVTVKVPYRTFSLGDQIMAARGGMTGRSPNAEAVARLFKRGGIHFKVTDLGKIFDAAANADPQAQQILLALFPEQAKWGSFGPIRDAVRKTILNSPGELQTIPSFVHQSLLLAMEISTGITLVELVAGRKAIRLRKKGINLFDLLPSREELQALLPK